MLFYIEKLIRTKEDLDSLIYAIETTGALYSSMLRDAIDRARTNTEYGVSSVGLARQDLSIKPD